MAGLGEGQIVYTRIMQAFAAEEYVFSKIVPNVPTQFNGEKIAGIFHAIAGAFNDAYVFGFTGQ